MGVRRVPVPEEVYEFAQGDSPGRRKVAAGLAVKPRVWACSGRARHLVPRGATAWTLDRDILVRASLWDEPSVDVAALIAHEIVHTAQWRENGRVRFIGDYLRPYFKERVAGFTHWDAYRRIPAEREAFAVQDELRAVFSTE